ncbi:MAG: hypothetical protein J1E57_05965 [Prevotella sp.]|nr:hypothetical protein [Prevotella sp.]
MSYFQCTWFHLPTLAASTANEASFKSHRNGMRWTSLLYALAVETG